MRAMSQLDLGHVAVGVPQVDRSGAPCRMLSGISARGKNQIEISSSVKSVAITPPPKDSRCAVSDVPSLRGTRKNNPTHHRR